MEDKLEPIDTDRCAVRPQRSGNSDSAVRGGNGRRTGGFARWFAGSRDDFILFVIAVVLLNLVCSRAFFRIDLTSARSYSLSPASRELVKTLDAPLSVKAFFSENLPAPYNSVEQYVRDLLAEYKGAANRHFSYEFYDVDKPENAELAAGYNIRPIQIQEIKNNEFGVKSAYMGLVLVYGDGMETLDGISSAEGFEYKLTTAMSRLISSVNTLAGLSGDVKLTLYVSSRLAPFGISGFDRIEQSVLDAYAVVKKQSSDKLTYQRVDPSPDEADSLAARYGLQTLSWKERDGIVHRGVIGAVLEYGDSFRQLPLYLSRTLFGGYAVAGLDELEQSLPETLKSLLAQSVEIGYVTGHGELDLNDTRSGAGVFTGLVSGSYTLKPLDLTADAIPAGLSTLMIAGPKTAFSEAELYKIDQFIMKGGNVMFLLDPFAEVAAQSYYEPSTFVPVETGLDRLLNAYGIAADKNYVMDAQCFESIQQGYGKTSLNFAPLIQKNGLNQKHVVSENLGYVLFLQAGSVRVLETADGGAHTVSILAQSSPESWTVSDNIVLNPLYVKPPAEGYTGREALALIAEGRFSSAFDRAPETADSETPGAANSAGSGDSALAVNDHLAQSVAAGKLFVAGSSLMLTPQMIDESGQQGIAFFMQNALDYLNGAPELCAMRTKGLSLDTLTLKNAAARKTAQVFNQYGVPALVALAGLIVWRLRVARRKKIRAEYAASDPRETDAVSETDNSGVAE